MMLPKVASKIWTSWEVRAISGTRRMTDWPFFRVSEARWRYIFVLPEPVMPKRSLVGFLIDFSS